MNRKDLAITFASQDAPRGRASALYFEGRVAYSYGEHFPLAVITAGPGDDKPLAATVNTDTYSSTTGQHKGYIRRALIARGYTLTEADTAAMKALAAEASG